MTGAYRGLLSVALFAVELSTAVACPLCKSFTGEQVQEGIFNVDFAYHLFAAMLPFMVSLGVVTLIRGRSPRSEENQVDDWRRVDDWETSH